MTDSRKSEPCRWIGPTLFLPYPYWIAAEQEPWSCLRDAEPRPLATTEDCRGCRRWESNVDARLEVTQ